MPSTIPGMTENPRGYLVLASQRSGSTLLVESLRATGVAGEPEEFFQYLPSTSLAPQPRQWFADVTDESVLRLLAPLTPGTVDTDSSVDWRARIRRDGATANGVWGGKLMWNQTPLLVQHAAGLPDRTGTDLRSAIRDVLGDNIVFVHVHRPDVVSQAVSFWRAVQTQVWRGRAEPDADAKAEYHADGIAHLVRILRDQEQGWSKWFADNGIEPIDVPYPVLAKRPTETIATVLEALVLDPGLAPPPALERQADTRSDGWVDRYRADAATEGLPL